MIVIDGDDFEFLCGVFAAILTNPGKRITTMYVDDVEHGVRLKFDTSPWTHALGKRDDT